MKPIPLVPLAEEDLRAVCAVALSPEPARPEHFAYAGRADARLMGFIRAAEGPPSRDRARRYVAVSGAQQRETATIGFRAREAGRIDRVLIDLRIPHPTA